MLKDLRLEKLAYNLVNYSCDIQKGDKVWIDVFGIDDTLPMLLTKEVYKKGGMPFVFINDNRVKREMLIGATDEMIEVMANRDAAFMNEMQAYIGVRGGQNSFELCDVPEDRMNAYSRIYAQRVHHKIRVAKTKWVVLRYPTEGMSQLSNMSTSAFEDFYFDVCNLDYAKMEVAMTPLVELMNKTDKVRIVAKDTDLQFSIKGVGAVKCSGHRNIPDGEVYTAPVRNSVNGVIHYNVPSIENGTKFEDVRLEFKEGKIVNATANFTQKANSIFDTDAGARYVGEFALGVNPFIKNPMGDILFDEKISGSIHFTPGACYDDAPNGNQSAVHWDLVLVQTEEYGGGEIWFDDVLVRKNGIFVLPELECLNPENLK
ncbi:MAG: aminopeptidase [Clostridia bacterium]|nr:aminopeptidase [Clostridia bacterium]